MPEDFAQESLSFCFRNLKLQRSCEVGFSTMATLDKLSHAPSKDLSSITDVAVSFNLGATKNDDFIHISKISKHLYR